MKFLADENVEKVVVAVLRARGFDVLYLCEEFQSIPDEDIIELATQEGRILVTNDKDFGELVYLQQHVTEGIVLIRSRSEKGEAKAALVEALVNQHGDELLNRFVVVSEAGVRIRELRG
jgi:predicted nuclease of predicted toxin-antitoxin system